MRKLLLAALAAMAWTVLPGAALADGTIPWEGNGSDNLPCEFGGHWVLAPSFGIESATLTVNGTEYTMVQHGNGSWSADSLGAIDAEVEAFVTFTGDGDEQNHLQLSHCTEGSPSPSPSESPSPSPSESPSESPSSSETDTPTTQPPLGSEEAPPTPRTGFGAGWLIAAAVVLALGGTLLLRLASRRA